MKKRRQFNTEKNTTPLEMVHATPSATKIMMNKICILLTLIFWGVYVASTIFDQMVRGNREFQKVVEAWLYILIVTSLCFSAMVYLISRHGALTRFKEHSRVPRATLEKFFSEHQERITVLIPSYDEEVAVIRQTMLSAALQEYPDIQIRLLIDDKPNPKDPDKKEKLDATIALAKEINQLLGEPCLRFQKARQGFEECYKDKSRVKPKSLIMLQKEYDYAAKWLRDFADQEPETDHVDDFFNNRVLRDLAAELETTARALEQAAKDKDYAFSVTRVYQMYSRLVWIFTAEVDYFQRKEYISLSNEANKAMNLNSYIDLMGGSYQLIHTPEGKILQRVEDEKNADVIIPDSEYLLTLDADSILLREYCLRLVFLLNQEGNERVAVTQTPYSSFRGCSTRIERIAGATTDIQHVLHQGTTYYGATFWVGANAVIRKRALEDIAEEEEVNGFKIRRFIQDRTVIEDTESSIDLEKHGWTLKNYPERLSYSATPPDYGSLIIQRRRWANGGLLILTKLFSTIRRRKKEGKPLRKMEIALRVNYMASIAWASFGLIFLLAYPFDDRLLSVYIVAAAVPYFACMASDLKYCRYRRSDIFRIYGFNLLLLAVNLAGVIKSLQQMLSGEKIPFARTPKVKDRTGSPTLYIISPLVIIGFSAFMSWRSFNKGNWANSAFAFFNAFTCLWAVLSYVGVFNMLADLLNNFYNWLFVEVKEEVAGENGNTEELDWKSVLYYGSGK
ncbi:cellulose synthase (UDP-forming) [Aequitasia blattaphilus]|uniref:Glycosyltransferase 2-like domain-containing protein n=1 Tax=Aequitasia blattaphilus TaxID=2949332 RepID=A0ABT1E8R9_9FIRM|nr:glycosyltransferase family 2 protein [Aequitasia blattaphilus]MCP1100912.1 hypothetical protein [Aequitasia blattaphilus]MCR8613552.1 hypothetical protein [Aequitasia blattaphilus]